MPLDSRECQGGRGLRLRRQGELVGDVGLGRAPEEAAAGRGHRREEAVPRRKSRGRRRSRFRFRRRRGDTAPRRRSGPDEPVAPDPLRDPPGLGAQEVEEAEQVVDAPGPPRAAGRPRHRPAPPGGQARGQRRGARGSRLDLLGLVEHDAAPDEACERSRQGGVALGGAEGAARKRGGKGRGRDGGGLGSRGRRGDDGVSGLPLGAAVDFLGEGLVRDDDDVGGGEITGPDDRAAAPPQDGGAGLLTLDAERVCVSAGDELPRAAAPLPLVDDDAQRARLGVSLQLAGPLAHDVRRADDQRRQGPTGGRGGRGELAVAGAVAVAVDDLGSASVEASSARPPLPFRWLAPPREAAADGVAPGVAFVALDPVGPGREPGGTVRQRSRAARAAGAVDALAARPRQAADRPAVSASAARFLVLGSLFLLALLQDQGQELDGLPQAHLVRQDTPADARRRREGSQGDAARDAVDEDRSPLRVLLRRLFPLPHRCRSCASRRLASAASRRAGGSGSSGSGGGLPPLLLPLLEDALPQRVRRRPASPLRLEHLPLPLLLLLPRDHPPDRPGLVGAQQGGEPPDAVPALDSRGVARGSDGVEERGGVEGGGRRRGRRG